MTGWTVLPTKSWRSANVVMIIGALRFQIGLASKIVSWRVDRRERIGDRRTGVALLLADVALNGCVVVVGIGIGGFDPVERALQARADPARARTSVLPTSRFRLAPFQ